MLLRELLELGRQRPTATTTSGPTVPTTEKKEIQIEKHYTSQGRATNAVHDLFYTVSLIQARMAQLSLAARHQNLMVPVASALATGSAPEPQKPLTGLAW